jgi:hypothetical protein
VGGFSQEQLSQGPIRKIGLDIVCAARSKCVMVVSSRDSNKSDVGHGADLM